MFKWRTEKHEGKYFFISTHNIMSDCRWQKKNYWENDSWIKSLESNYRISRYEVSVEFPIFEFWSSNICTFCTEIKLASAGARYFVRGRGTCCLWGQTFIYSWLVQLHNNLLCKLFIQLSLFSKNQIEFTHCLPFDSKKL